VANEKEFQQKIRQLGVLVGELDQAPGVGSKAAARELVQLLMEVHGTGLERMMELVFESGAHGEALISRFGNDPIVRNLLLLYSLHPDDLTTRVLTALDTAGARLRKFDSQVELVGIRDGSVQLRLHTSGHACGSTTKNLQTIIEEAVYELAPDLTSLEIFGSESETASGFFPLEKLLRQEKLLEPPFGGNHLPVPVVEMDGAD
jgi:Fe-S cluster biogenesis protein NfuA